MSAAALEDKAALLFLLVALHIPFPIAQKTLANLHQLWLIRKKDKQCVVWPRRLSAARPSNTAWQGECPPCTPLKALANAKEEAFGIRQRKKSK